MKLTLTRNIMSLLPFQKLRSNNPIATMITHMTSVNTSALGAISSNVGNDSLAPRTPYNARPK